MSGPSIREQIMVQMETLLNATGKPPGLTVHRQRTRPIEQDKLPAILFYAEDDPSEPLAGITYKAPLQVCNLVVRFECRAQASDSLPPDAALDPLLVWASNQMTQNESMDGLANGVVPTRTTWISKEGDIPVAAAALFITVKYRTDSKDMTKRGPNE